MKTFDHASIPELERMWREGVAMGDIAKEFGISYRGLKNLIERLRSQQKAHLPYRRKPKRKNNPVVVAARARGISPASVLTRVRKVLIMEGVELIDSILDDGVNSKEAANVQD